ncbi:MAG: hypothetical protein HOO95_07245 [Gallionella sp.]|nr:hypothetical protein [Gallionella sp.]
MQTVEEKIACLERFDVAVTRWFEGKYDPEGQDVLRKSLNEMMPIARNITHSVGCLQLMSVAPPPAIGGMVLNNINPFDGLFQTYYGQSLIPNIRDMTQQAIGLLRSGRLEEVKEIPRNSHLPLPEKVTLAWLALHVSMKHWFMVVGILAAVFMLGVKVSTIGFIRELLGLS